MDAWELVSLFSFTMVVVLFSGPRAAFTRSIQDSSFEVFVEAVDRMNGTLAPALIVLLPGAFLSLFLEILKFYRVFPKLMLLDGSALLLLFTALVCAFAFELPIVEEIAKWPARLTTPENWQAVRKRWLTIHVTRVVLAWFGLLILIGTGCVRAIIILMH